MQIKVVRSAVALAITICTVVPSSAFVAPALSSCCRRYGRVQEQQRSCKQLDCSPARAKKRQLQIAHARAPNISEVAENAKTERILGVLVLLTVPLAWGTYTPVVRYIYEVDPPVPGLLFSAAYYVVASITTTVLALCQSNSRLGNEHSETKPSERTFPVRAGVELGGYLFLANCLQIVGLRTVESDRAGFLVQLTTIFVPILEAILLGDVFALPGQTWFACLLAFAGLIIMGYDGNGSAMLSDPSLLLHVGMPSFSGGDALIVSAAVLYTIHVVRLGRFAKESNPIELASAKATFEAIMSVLLVTFLASLSVSGATGDDLIAFAGQTGEEIRSFLTAFSRGLSTGTFPQSSIVSIAGAVLWTGWVTCAYTIFAQSYGQSRVSPTNANLIYTFQPIFTALFAYFLLGETMGPLGFLGGGLVAFSVYLVAASSEKELGESATSSDGPFFHDSEDPGIVESELKDKEEAQFFQ